MSGPARLIRFATLLAALATLPALAHAQATLTGIGDLPGGLRDSSAHGISANGVWVLGHSSGATGRHLVGWNATTGLVDLSTASAATPVGVGATDNASIVIANELIATPTLPLPHWCGVAAIPGVGTLSAQALFAPGTTDLSLRAVNRTGTLFGGASLTSQGYGATLVFPTGPVSIANTLPGGFLTEVHAVGPARPMAVGFGQYGPAHHEAFLHHACSGRSILLGNLGGPGPASFAWALSEDAFAVVGESISPSGTEAFLWYGDMSGGVLTPLGDVPGGAFHSVAKGVSARSEVVVGNSANTTTLDGFIWDASAGMRRLLPQLAAWGANTSGWDDLTVQAMSPNGVIVGYGQRRSGSTVWLEGFVATVRVRTACYPDWDHNGTLDNLDVIGFAATHAAGDPRADCDNNCVVNAADAVCFQALLQTGCP